MDNNSPQKNQFKSLSLQELKNLYFHDPYIPYYELLRVDEWDKKRYEILDRDKFRCQNCKSFHAYINKNGLLVWGFSDVIIWEDLEETRDLALPKNLIIRQTNNIKSISITNYILKTDILGNIKTMT